MRSSTLCRCLLLLLARPTGIIGPAEEPSNARLLCRHPPPNHCCPYYNVTCPTLSFICSYWPLRGSCSCIGSPELGRRTELAGNPCRCCSAEFCHHAASFRMDVFRFEEHC